MMNLSQAETLAIDALAWLAQDDDLMMRFFAMSGAGADDLRARAREPEFLGFVLDFILSDDAVVIGYAEASNRPPEDVQMARMALPGGDHPNWT